MNETFLAGIAIGMSVSNMYWLAIVWLKGKNSWND